jgi:anti-anti-sigma regulatory factor
VRDVIGIEEVGVANTGNSEEPEVAVRWDQDRLQRVVHFAGRLGPEAASHLESAIVGVGTRRLIIDLNEVSEIDDACVDALVDLIQRMGDDHIEFRLDTQGPVADRLGPLAEGTLAGSNSED